MVTRGRIHSPLISIPPIRPSHPLVLWAVMAQHHTVTTIMVVDHRKRVMGMAHRQTGSTMVHHLLQMDLTTGVPHLHSTPAVSHRPQWATREVRPHRPMVMATALHRLLPVNTQGTIRITAIMGIRRDITVAEAVVELTSTYDCCKPRILTSMYSR